MGTNTDIEGFIAPLQTTYKQDWSQKVAVILGNGGAARAVVAGCQQLGFAKIHVVTGMCRDYKNSAIVGGIHL